MQISCDGSIYFGEVIYFFSKIIRGELRAFALVSLYSPPNEYLLQQTNDTLVVCRYRGETALMVINVKLILSVVAMIPFPFLLDGRSDQYFMVEKFGLDVIEANDLEDSE